MINERKEELLQQPAEINEELGDPQEQEWEGDEGEGEETEEGALGTGRLTGRTTGRTARTSRTARIGHTARGSTSGRGVTRLQGGQKSQRALEIIDQHYMTHNQRTHDEKAMVPHVSCPSAPCAMTNPLDL